MRCFFTTQEGESCIMVLQYGVAYIYIYIHTYIYIQCKLYIYIYIYHKVLSMKLQNSLMDIQDAILPTQMFSLALHSTAA